MLGAGAICPLCSLAAARSRAAAAAALSNAAQKADHEPQDLHAFQDSGVAQAQEGEWPPPPPPQSAEKQQERSVGMNSVEFRQRGREMVEYIARYMETIRERRVTPQVEPGYLKELLPDTAPDLPEDWDTIIADVEKHIMPGVRIRVIIEHL